MIRAVQQRAEQVLSGFQSPADDYLEGRLNIADILVVDPECTFYFQMDSNAMRYHGLRSGDILVIDRSLKAVHGALVIAFFDGAFYCRRYEVRQNRPVLVCDEDKIETSDDESLQVWGVVTATCRNELPVPLRKGKYRRVCTL